MTISREEHALTLLLRTGRVQVVHQDDYRFVRVRVAGMLKSNADCLIQVFGGTCKNNRWTASDKGSIEAVADALVGAGGVALGRLGGILKRYATAPYGDSTKYAEAIEAAFGSRTIRLDSYRWRD